MNSLRSLIRRKVNAIRKQYYYYHRDGELIFCESNVGEVSEGVSYTIKGHMSLVCERFSISLVHNNATCDIALRITPLLPQNYIVRNSRVKHRWGTDEEASAQPFNLRRGTGFNIQILVTDQRYMISINRNHFAMYIHRIPYKNVARIEVHGDVSRISIERKEVTEYPESVIAKEIHIKDNFGLRSSMPNFSRYSLRRSFVAGLQLPFYGILEPRNLGYGKHLVIKGRVNLLPWSFYINLQTGQKVWPHPTVALHFHSCFAMHRDYINENVITCCAWLNGQWTYEEIITLTTDLSPAKTFDLVIVSQASSYEVYVNKKFVTEFQFRMDPDVVDTVLILGDIKLFDVKLEDHNAEDFSRVNPPVIDRFRQRMFYPFL